MVMLSEDSEFQLQIIKRGHSATPRNSVYFLNQYRNIQCILTCCFDEGKVLDHALEVERSNGVERRRRRIKKMTQTVSQTT